jgi:hypothetical protein
MPTGRSDRSIDDEDNEDDERVARTDAVLDALRRNFEDLIELAKQVTDRPRVASRGRTKAIRQRHH